MVMRVTTYIPVTCQLTSECCPGDKRLASAIEDPWDDVVNLPPIVKPPYSKFIITTNG